MANSANAKNFPINTSTTTSDTFQIDSENSGPKLKNNSGVLEVRNEADDAYAIAKALKLTLSGQDFCSVYRNANQTVSAGAEELMEFDTEVSDTGFFNTTTSIATIVTAGVYLITTFARLNGIGDGKSMNVQIRINDTRMAYAELNAGASANLTISVTWVATLAVGDTVKGYIVNNDSSDRTMQGGQGTNGMCIVRLF